jgi:hypothetical protein
MVRRDHRQLGACHVDERRGHDFGQGKRHARLQCLVTGPDDLTDGPCQAPGETGADVARMRPGQVQADNHQSQ